MLSMGNLLENGLRIEDQMGEVGGYQRVGKKIVSDCGSAGYVGWNHEDDWLSMPGWNTARLERIGEINGIEVSESREGEGEGRRLLDTVIDQAASDGFNRFLIVGAANRVKGFYDKVLRAKACEGVLSIHSVTERKHADGYIDYIYDTILR